MKPVPLCYKTLCEDPTHDPFSPVDSRERIRQIFETWATDNPASFTKEQLLSEARMDLSTRMTGGIGIFVKHPTKKGGTLEIIHSLYTHAGPGIHRGHDFVYLNDLQGLDITTLKFDENLLDFTPEVNLVEDADTQLSLLISDNLESVQAWANSAACTSKQKTRNSMYIPEPLIPYVIGNHLTPKQALTVLYPLIVGLELLSECKPLLTFLVAATTNTVDDNKPVTVQNSIGYAPEDLLDVVQDRRENLLYRHLPRLCPAIGQPMNSGVKMRAAALINLDDFERPRPYGLPRAYDDSIEVVTNSFRFKDKELFPLWNHRERQIFKIEEVRREVARSIVGVYAQSEDIISGKTEKEFLKSYQSSMGGNGIVDFSAAANSEYKTLKSQSKDVGPKNSKVFSKTRLQISHKYFKVCPTIFHSWDELEKFVSPDFYHHLRAINSKDKASKFLHQFGHLYIVDAYLGGLRTYSSDDSMSALNKLVTSSVELSSTALSSFLSQSKIQKEASTPKGKTGGTTIGGNVRLASDATNNEKWMNSLSDENIQLCQCNFEPLYKLLSKECEDEIMKNIRLYLKWAYYLTIGKIETRDDSGSWFQNYLKTDKCYSISNKMYGKIERFSCVEVCKAEGKKIPKSQSLNVLNHDNRYIKMGHVRTHDICVFLKGVTKLKSVETSEHKTFFLRRSKTIMKTFRFPIIRRRTVQFDKDEGNEENEISNFAVWRLKHVPNLITDNTNYIILSPNGRHMLGLRTGLNKDVGNDTSHFILGSYKWNSKHKKRIPSKFLWEFKLGDTIGDELESETKVMKKNLIWSGSIARLSLSL